MQAVDALPGNIDKYHAPQWLGARDDALDAFYQLEVHGTVHPGEAIGIAVLPGFVPYLLIGGPAGRLARRRRRGGSHGEVDHAQHSRHLG
jgi:hypothetical protein